MKFLKKLFPVILVAGTVVTVSALASGDDPLISLSYLNEIFMPKVETKIAETTVYSVITVEKGKTFVAGAGCEFIVRSGSASVISSASGGICDTTDGVDLSGGTVAPSNHLLIAPRDDGRGFSATTDVILMVKGSYTIR
ncbi:MAG: hypothetical protein J6A61_06725 [Clostridia bacterium]|nr:hypothetical protein [Clostridia bacterium]